MSDRDFKTGGAFGHLRAAASKHGPADALIGTRIGPYRLRQLIATGGMGRVYRGERADGSFERAVAVKVLPRGMGGDYARRFELERRILGGLEHPGIAQLFDAGVTETGSLYLVMELVDGLPIDEHVRTMQLGVDDCVRLVATLCDALAFAHARLVIHRDLKPSNVLVTRDGVPKLLDFGIAKVLESPDWVTKESRPMTPRYASPEQLLDEPVSVASDIYQVGLLLLEVLGNPPDESESRSQAIERAVRKQSITMPPELAATLPRDLAAITNRCLRADPAERYGSVESLARDLRNHLAGYPVVARNPGPVARAGKFLKRNAVPTALAALLLGAVAGGTVLHIRGIEAERAAVIAANEKAEAEAEIARAMSDFLVQMISGANAVYTPGEPRTVPEAVIRGAELLEEKLQDQPTVRARMAITLGGVLNSMGEWQKARDLLGAVTPALIDDRTIDFETRGRLQSSLAYADYRLSDFDGARAQYEDIIRRYEDAGRTDEIVYANAWRRLGLLERRAANYALGVENMRRAEAAYERTEQSEGELAGFYGDYGLVLMGADLLDEAIAKMERSIDAFRAEQGDPCPRCAITMLNLAEAQRKEGRLEAALGTIDEADAIFTQTLGEDHRYTANLLNEKAAVMNISGRYEEAVALHERVTEIYRERHGERHSLYAMSLYNHARTHEDHGHCERAVTLLEQARRAHVEIFGEGSEWVGRDDRALARCRDQMREVSAQASNTP